MPKRESENYKAVSVVVVLLLFAAFVFLTLGNLSHAFNQPAGSSDEGYAIDGSGDND